MKAIRRPLLRYYGSKWTLAPWIIENFPDHDGYVEPFAGAAAVLLRKRPEPIEVYNDADGEVVNLFRVMREQPEQLIRAIELTPYAREELYTAYTPDGDPLERARRLYIRAWQGHGGARAQWRTGWRFQRSDNQRTTVVRDWNDNGRLNDIAGRLKNVQIEHDDAFAIIERFDAPGTLFYCDPPYMPDTRSERWRSKGYAVEFSAEQHEQLASLLSDIDGMAIVSGYPSPEYAEWYSGWTMLTKTARVDPHNKAPRGDKRWNLATECLWLSPRAAARARQTPLLEVVSA